MRVRSHAQRTFGNQGEHVCQRPTGSVEEFLGPVTAHPLLEDLPVFRVGADLADRHLVRTERALNLLSVDLLRAGPTLWRAQHERGPARAGCCRCAACARLRLDLADAI